jgi:hypothetical protein
MVSLLVVGGCTSPPVFGDGSDFFYPFATEAEKLLVY